jgi:hypothetical protein
MFRENRKTIEGGICMKTKTDMNKGFEVSSVCRTDLTDRFTQSQIDLLTDDDMERIARKMGDAFCDYCYWEALEVWTKAILEEK